MRKLYDVKIGTRVNGEIVNEEIRHLSVSKIEDFIQEEILDYTVSNEDELEKLEDIIYNIEEGVEFHRDQYNGKYMVVLENKEYIADMVGAYFGINDFKNLYYVVDEVGQHFAVSEDKEGQCRYYDNLELPVYTIDYFNDLTASEQLQYIEDFLYNIEDDSSWDGPYAFKDLIRKSDVVKLCVFRRI